MRITTILLLIGSLHVCATGISQTVTLNVKNLPLRKVLKEISKQTGTSILCDESLFDLSKPVTMNLENANLKDALDICFKDQLYTYEIIGKTIVIKEKTIALKSTTSTFPPTIIPIVNGLIQNEKGEPLIGASILIKNSIYGTETNQKGEFEIRNVASDAVLIISYSGYINKIYSLNGQASFTLKLSLSNSSLDQVQIIAYGSTTERLNTGDVSTISAKEISAQPVNNPLLALEGRVPGLFISQNTGISGGAVSVVIQGKNSIAFGTYPYYVVDGVPYTSTLLSLSGAPSNPLGMDNGGNQAGQGTGNPLSFINPADIESISVLKDADATAIYGSRAANGAIIITTKKGKAGKTKIDINTYTGWGKITRSLSLLNTPQYLKMRHEALANDGATPSLDNADYDLLLWDTTRYTNWEKTLIGNTSKYKDIQGSVSGGNSNTKFLIGAGFHSETAVFPGSFSDIKGSLHFNISNVSDNQKFHIQLTGNYLIDNNQLPATDPTNSAITLPPDAPPVYKPNGTLNWEPSPTGYTSWLGSALINPIAYLYNSYNNKTNNLVASALVNYTLLPGLDVKCSFGYTNKQMDESNTTPATANDPALLPIYGNSIRSAIYANSNLHSWIIEPQATYSRSFGKGTLVALLGSTFNQITNNGQVLNGTGYNSDLSLNNILAAASVSVSSVVNSIYKYEALFGRINYNWEDKYLANLSIRRDGSSRFGPANQFHNFGAGGVAWIFTKEDFVRNALPFLSFGKLRASYGTTGNDQIGDYRFMDLYTPPYGITAPYQGTTGAQINNLYNPNLSWEETKKLEFGFDIGILKDVILLQATYYKNRTSNELVGAQLPYVTGFSSITENLPAIVQNDGWEIVLNTKNITSTKFNWSTSFNFTVPRNRLISVSPSMGSLYQHLVGHSLQSIMIYHFLRVNDTTGVYQFASKQGPTSNPSLADATVIQDLNPVYYGGLLNSFKYNGFQLDFLFQFTKQVGLNYLFGQNPGSAGYNQPTTVLKRWQKPGDITNIQRYNSDYSLVPQENNAYMSEGGFTDASYIRLKNLSLSYQFPPDFLQKVHIENLRIYVQAQNLLTFTNYIGMDPENKSTFSLPPLKVITMGIQVTL